MKWSGVEWVAVWIRLAWRVVEEMESGVRSGHEWTGAVVWRKGEGSAVQWSGAPTPTDCALQRIHACGMMCCLRTLLRHVQNRRPQQAKSRSAKAALEVLRTCKNVNVMLGRRCLVRGWYPAGCVFLDCSYFLGRRLDPDMGILAVFNA